MSNSHPMSMIFLRTIIFLLLCVVGISAQERPAQPSVAQESETETLNPRFERLAPPDRGALRRLEQARRLIEAERLSEAAQLLGAILEGHADFFFPSPTYSPTDYDTPTTQALFGQIVFNTLLGLPSEARESYLLQYETQASRLLDQAIQSGSIEGVQQVSKRYFLTQSGAEATLLLALDQIERGAFAAAAWNLEKLLQSGTKKRRDFTDLEPMLSLSLAVCQLRLKRADDARATVENYARQFPNAEIVLFGTESWTPRSADEILARLTKDVESATKISCSAWLENAGWLLSSGSASQTPETAAEKPLLETRWSTDTVNSAAAKRAAQKQARQMRVASPNAIPAAQPLLVQNRLVARSADELMAMDVETGKLLWTAKQLEYRVSKPLQNQIQRSVNPWQFGGGHMAELLYANFWSDRILQQLSSDGNRIFSVEGHDLRQMRMSGFGQGRPNLRLGRQTVEDPRGGPGNTLVARDSATGQILWQVGKFPYVQKCFDQLQEDFEMENGKSRQKNDEETATDPTTEKHAEQNIGDEQRFLGETWFLGAPLPLEDSLYVLGENAGLLRLIILKADNGRLIRQIPLAVPSASLENDALRKFYGLLPSAADGMIVCPTGLGLIVAIDATTATPVWCYSYGEPENAAQRPGNRRQFQFLWGAGAGHLQSEEHDGWRVPSIRIDHDRVLVAPTDDSALHCLDLKSGTLLWKNDRLKRTNSNRIDYKTLYVACIRDEKIFVVTDRGMLVLDGETGKPVKESRGGLNQPTLVFAEMITPSGQGVQSGPTYFLPLKNGSYGVAVGVMDLDALTLEILPASNDFATENNMLLGNLIGIRDKFFTQTLSQVLCFDQRDPLERYAQRRLDTHPDDPKALVQLGRIRNAHNKQAEAIELFRKARAAGSKESTDYLRKTLLTALRNDYKTWKSGMAELEAFCEFPEELGAFLSTAARGALQAGDDETLLELLRKTFRLEMEQPILIEDETDSQARLSSVLGTLVAEYARRDPRFRTKLSAVAESVFQGLERKKPLDEFLSIISVQKCSTSVSRSETQPWQAFLALFQNWPGMRRADQLLEEIFIRQRQYGALEQKINLPPSPTSPQQTADARRLADFLLAENNAADALYYLRYANVPLENETQNPVVRKQWEREKAAQNWPGGKVVLEDRTQNSDTFHEDNPRAAALAGILRSVREPRLPYGGHHKAIPFLGSYEPFLSSCTYDLETDGTNLVCYDSLGQERWRCEMPSLGQDMFSLQSNFVASPQSWVNHSLDHTVYLKGCHHLLVFVRESSLIALDTFGCSPNREPKILWTKTLQTTLPCRQSVRAGSLGDANDGNFPIESLFVGPDVICYRDADRLVGLDPLSGQELWSRYTPDERCSILGNRENLFVVFPALRQAQALDRVSGRELASGTIPEGGAFVFGSNIVFVQQHSVAEALGDAQPFQLHVADLRDLFQKRRRALIWTDDDMEGGLTSIPLTPIRSDLTDEAMIRPVHNGRFLATVSWTTKSLQIFDLETKQDMLGPVDAQGRRTGAKLPDMTGKEPQRRHDSDFDVEFFEDTFLVSFTEKGEVNPRYKNEADGRGGTIPRQRLPVQNQASRNVGVGSMMLYNTDGSTCWAKPVRIEDWFRIQETPRDLPVALFAVTLDERTSAMGLRVQKRFTALWAIDKRTGTTRFRCQVPHQWNRQQVPLQGFRVEADPWNKTLLFISPQRTVSAEFTNENDVPVKKPETPKPNMVERMFGPFAGLP